MDMKEYRIHKYCWKDPISIRFEHICVEKQTWIEKIKREIMFGMIGEKWPGQGRRKNPVSENFYLVRIFNTDMKFKTQFWIEDKRTDLRNILYIEGQASYVEADNCLCMMT